MGNASLRAWPVCLVFSSICYWLLVEMKWCSSMAFGLTQCRCPCVFIWRQTKSFFSIKEIILGGAQRSALESFQNSHNTAKEKFKVGCLFLFGSFKAFFLKLKGQRKKGEFGEWWFFFVSLSYATGRIRKISGMPQINVEYKRVHTKRSKQIPQKLTGSGGTCTFFIVPHFSLRQQSATLHNMQSTCRLNLSPLILGWVNATILPKQARRKGHCCQWSENRWWNGEEVTTHPCLP